jgi:hypothetical protein
VRELHVLGVSEDGATLLLGTSKNATKPTHRIPLDDRLRTAARGQMAAFGSDRAESGLTPKEMQARLREGASVEEVAKAAGVPVARVLPYFVPVEAERTRIVDEARAAHMHRHRGPAASRPLGQAVDTRLQEVAGLKPESVTWTARRRRDGAWVVGVSYSARGRRKAEWLWQPAGREVTPLDAAAGRLGGDGVAAPAKRKAAAAKPAKAAKAAKAAKPAKAAAGRRPAKKAAKPGSKKAATAAKSGTARKAATRTTPKAAPVRKTAVKAAPARKAAVKAAPARKAAAVRRATTKPVRAPKAVTPRRPRPVPTPASEVEEGPFFAPAVIKLPVAPVAAPVEEPVEETAAPVEQPEQGQEQEQEAAPGATGRRKGQRVPLPSWSDVLLGVTRDETRRSG